MCIGRSRVLYSTVFTFANSGDDPSCFLVFHFLTFLVGMGTDVNARWQRISIENNANYDITEKKRKKSFLFS